MFAVLLNSWGFGRPIAEAIAEGIPVITSSIGSMRDLGISYGLKLANLYSVDEIGDSLYLAIMGRIEVPRPFHDEKHVISWRDYVSAVWGVFAK